MKPLFVASALLAALPLLAEETAQKPAEPQPKPAAAPQQISPAPAPAPVESPLAAAARKSKRNASGKKSVVITDDMIRTSKGHITTTNVNPQFNLDPPKTSEKDLIAAQEKEKAAQKVKADEEAKKAEVEKKKLERRARAADLEEGEEAGYGETDPAAADKPVEEEPAKKPQ